jgi:hypothetical protein
MRAGPWPGNQRAEDTGFQLTTTVLRSGPSEDIRDTPKGMTDEARLGLGRR